MTSRVVEVQDCGPEGFRWLTLKHITWEDPLGRKRLWEAAERTTRKGEVDGVAIVAKISGRGRPAVLPVLKQFRPPVANHCLELPAGLVDGGESAGQAAVRELLEETGYTGRVVEETAVCVSDPGMSNANMRYVRLEVDADAPENQSVVQRLEDGEFIQVELVPWDGLLQHLQAEMAATGCEVDARLLSYALGLEHAKEAAAYRAAAATEPGQATGTAPQSRGSGGLESGGSWAGLPFGSPILSTQASTARAPPPVLLLGGAAGGGGGIQRRAAAWLFAAGLGVGAAVSWLLLAAGVRGGRGRQ